MQPFTYVLYISTERFSVREALETTVPSNHFHDIQSKQEDKWKYVRFEINIIEVLV